MRCDANDEWLINPLRHDLLSCVLCALDDFPVLFSFLFLSPLPLNNVSCLSCSPSFTLSATKQTEKDDDDLVEPESGCCSCRDPFYYNTKNKIKTIRAAHSSDLSVKIRSRLAIFFYSSSSSCVRLSRCKPQLSARKTFLMARLFSPFFFSFLSIFLISIFFAFVSTVLRSFQHSDSPVLAAGPSSRDDFLLRR